MSATEDNQQPPAPVRTSRLVVLSLFFACWAMLSFWLASGPREFGLVALSTLISFVIMSVFALVIGIVALAKVKRSRGGLAGRGIAVTSICVGAICVSFILYDLFHAMMTVPRHETGVRITKAAATIQGLCTAANAYYFEYSRWLQPRNSGDLVLIFGGVRHPRTGEDVCDKRPDLLAQNSRRIAFMDFRAKDVTPPKSSGKPASDELAFYDPWGTPYGFAFDNGIGGIYYRGPGTNNPTPWPDTKAGDGVIPLPFASADGGTNVIRAGCAFFSNGPDGLTGTPETEADDIRSWK